MITLKIKKAGYTVDIPGIPTCRSPVEIDISKMDIRIVAMTLKTAGISEYEIVADIGKGIREVYSKEDFEGVEKRKKDKPQQVDLSGINKRFNKLENMLATLLSQQQGSSSLEKEQITNKLNNLEKLISSQRSGSPSPLKTKVTIEGEPEIEEFDSFIPDIDTSQMKIESKNMKVVKKESDDLDDTADALSSLLKPSGGK